MNLPIPSTQTALQIFEPEADAVYSIEVTSHLTQVSRRRIAIYCRHGLVSPVTAPECRGWYFNDEAVRTLRRIEQLRAAYGMNIPSLWVVCELMREIEQLRQEVRFLRKR